MKILLSAYACEPGKGSEPGVGWHWAVELARLGHEVAVITRANNQALIDGACAGAAPIGLRFHYYDLPPWARRWKRGPRGIYLYYWLWQLGAYRLAKRLVVQTKFDMVHHLTFGVFRQPSFMGRLGLPFIIGPLGGGETAPALLGRRLHFKSRLQESLRGASNKLALWDPSVRAMFSQAAIILCKTSETRAFLPACFRSKCRLHIEVGLEPERIRHPSGSIRGGTDFLYAGRLIYWKGLHLALMGFAEFKRTSPAATLTVIGTGPDEEWLRRLASLLGIQDAVRWLGWLPQERLWEHYSGYSAFLFPSLHDSSGNVLLEALSQGLPVICLDANGPRAVVPVSAGIKVRVLGRRQDQVIADIAAAMRTLADDPALRAQMGRCAMECASARTWRAVVSAAYAAIADAFNRPSSESARVPGNQET